MAVESLLHSGSFLDKDGNKITVSFYSRVDLNVYPDVNSSGYTNIPKTRTNIVLVIWSRDGSARMWDPPCDWITYRQVASEQLPGSDYYKYTYQLTIEANNTGSARQCNIGIGLETGPVVGKLIDLPIKQLG